MTIKNLDLHLSFSEAEEVQMNLTPERRIMKSNHRASLLSLVTALSILAQPLSSRALHAFDAPETSQSQGSIISLLQGENTGINYTLRAQAGYLSGEARELVYDFDLGYRRKTSELVWDLKNLYMVGVVQTLSIRNVFNINLGIWTAVNQGNGGMEDYDWVLNTPGAPSIDAWTDRSVSDVQVVNALLLDLNVTAILTKWQDFTLRGVLGIKQDSWEWDDKAYEYVYSSSRFRDTVGSFGGANVINYEQTFIVPYVGLNASKSFGNLSLGSYFIFSLGVIAEDKDYHVLRGIHFKETFLGGGYFGVGLNASYKITDSLFISGAVDYQGIPEISGDLEYTTSTGETGKSYETAGISHSSVMVSASIGYRF